MTLPEAEQHLSLALEAAVTRFGTMVRPVGRRYRLDESGLDEVMQEVRIRLWRAQGTSEQVGETNTSYVYRTASSAALDVLRRRRSRQADRHDAIDDGAVAVPQRVVERRGPLEVIHRGGEVVEPEREHAQPAVGEGEALLIPGNFGLGEHLPERGLRLSQPAAKLKLVAPARGQTRQRGMVVRRAQEPLRPIHDREHGVSPSHKAVCHGMGLEALAGEPPLSQALGRDHALAGEVGCVGRAGDRSVETEAAKVLGSFPGIARRQQCPERVEHRERRLQPAGGAPGIAEPDQRIDLAATISDPPGLRDRRSQQRVGAAIVTFPECHPVEPELCLDVHSSAVPAELSMRRKSRSAAGKS
ncbi:MAG: hypothetical protein H0T68_09175 [Gemmatimonadales bacterium]|nr:hypothetical protein [Gemmatimonadales bacterium]